jgi:hypothetical protein
MKNTTIPIVYIGITIPMVPLPLGAGTTCPAPPIGGLIPGIGPGRPSFSTTLGTACECGIARPRSRNAGCNMSGCKWGGLSWRWWLGIWITPTLILRGAPSNPGATPKFNLRHTVLLNERTSSRICLYVFPRRTFSCKKAVMSTPHLFRTSFLQVSTPAWVSLPCLKAWISLGSISS